MAKKENKTVVLEDVELKPQVIGVTYQKKSNLGRILIIFAILVLVVYFINDISVLVNNLIGKQSAETIKDNTSEKKKDKKDDTDSKVEIQYNKVSDNLSLKLDNLDLTNFKYENNTITFDVANNSEKTIDLSSKKYYIETYSENKTLLERYKLDIDSFNASTKKSYSFPVANAFDTFSIQEKHIDDYPAFKVDANDHGVGTLTCVKGIDTIAYTFINDELSSIKHTINDNSVSDSDYSSRVLSAQNTVNSYKNIGGVTATINTTDNGYTAIISLDLQSANLEDIKENYYYAYKEKSSVINFEMQTYGFKCN